MLPLIITIVIVVLIAAAIAFAILSKRASAADDDAGGKQFDYTLNDALLTPAERSFYGALKACTGNQLSVFAKVRLADVFSPAKRVSGGERRSAQNKLNQKHVDFLLCRADNLAPVAGIELDDSSHKRPDRQKSDEFKNSLFAASSIPLIRVVASDSYSPNELATTVNGAIAAKKSAANT